MTGRCLIGQTRLPTRQQRRISNLVPHAGVISSPKASSTGLALKIGSREASPIHPGLVALPGSGAVLETPGAASLRDRILRLSIPEPNSGCWLWLGAIKENGYGRIKVGGRFRRAHRVSLEAFSGQCVPADKLVCHKCDVPGCVNPAHLFIGTVRDNSLDMWRKGRGFLAAITGRGSQNGNAKLSVDTVLKIRADTGTLKEIADRFGLSRSTVYNIITRRHWRHI